jgi:hypothetical protein
MPAAAWKVYATAAEKIARNTLDLDTHTFRIVLLTSAYTPNQNTHSTFADISAAQVSGTGYTSNGLLITQAVARSGANVNFDCDDRAWAASTITAKYAAIVRDADANGALVSGDDLLCFCDLEDLGGSVSTTAATFTITMNAGGLFNLTVS